MTTVAELALPGSDADAADDDQATAIKVERLTAFYDAIVGTYRRLCETVFAGVREHFLFAQFPCRAIVHYYPDPRPRFPPSFCIVRYWDPVESWAEAATVVHLGSEPSHEEFEVLAATRRKFCADRGPRHVEFKVSHTSDSGMWSAWQELVTEAVHELLRADIESLMAMVPDPYR